MKVSCYSWKYTYKVTVYTPIKHVKLSPTGPGGPWGPGTGTPRESWKVLVKNGSFPRSRIETKCALVKQEFLMTWRCPPVSATALSLVCTTWPLHPLMCYFASRVSDQYFGPFLFSQIEFRIWLLLNLFKSYLRTQQLSLTLKKHNGMVSACFPQTNKHEYEVDFS